MRAQKWYVLGGFGYHGNLLVFFSFWCAACQVLYVGTLGRDWNVPKTPSRHHDLGLGPGDLTGGICDHCRHDSGVFEPKSVLWHNNKNHGTENKVN